MINKLILITFGLLVILDNIYGQLPYQRTQLNSTSTKNKTVATSTNAHNEQDYYYDNYDYDVSNGYRKEMSKTLVYSTSLFIAFCFIRSRAMFFVSFH